MASATEPHQFVSYTFPCSSPASPSTSPSSSSSFSLTVDILGFTTPNPILSCKPEAGSRRGTTSTFVYLKTDHIVSLNHILFGIKKVVHKFSSSIEAENSSDSKESKESVKWDFATHLCCCISGTGNKKKSVADFSISWDSSSSPSSSPSSSFSSASLHNDYILLVFNPPSSTSPTAPEATRLTSTGASISPSVSSLLANQLTTKQPSSTQKADRLCTTFKITKEERELYAGEDGKGLEGCVLTRVATKDFVKI